MAKKRKMKAVIMSELDIIDRAINLFGIIAFFFFIFSGAAYGYECWNGTNGAFAWYSLDNAQHSGTTTIDICNHVNLTEFNTPTIGASGVFGEAYDFDSTSNEYATTGAGGDMNRGTANQPISISYWINSDDFSAANHHAAISFGYESGGTQEVMSGVWNKNIQNHTFKIRSSGADYHYENVQGFSWPTNQWYHIVHVWNGTEIQHVFINNTHYSLGLQVDAGAANLAGFVVPTEFTIGGVFPADVSYDFDGTIDEVAVFNYSISENEISNLFNYNNISGITGGGGACGTASVVLSSPADGDHDNVAPDWNYTPTSFSCDDEFTGCYLFANETLRASNSTNLNNASINTLSWNPTEGYYSWFVGCNFSNGTFVNSTIWNFTMDLTSPTVNIYTPTNTQEFYYYTSNNLNVTANDTNMFNVSCDINFTNGTFVTQYKNDTGTPPIFTLYNEFTSGLLVGNYTITCHGSDDHTLEDDKGDITKFNNKRLDVKDGDGKKIGEITNNESFISKVQLDKLTDRVKVTYYFTKPLKSFTERVTSTRKIFIRDKSSYAAHLVFGDRWFDAEGAENQGWTVKTKRIDDYTVDILYTHPIGLDNIEPEVGGLNVGNATANFSVINNSALSLNIGIAIVGQPIIIIAHYTNVSDNAHIPAAQCNYTLTFPNATTSTNSMTDIGTHYLTSITTDAIGTHSFLLFCGKTGWTNHTISDTFNVLSQGADYSISIQVESGDEVTNQYCNGDNRVVELNKTVCLENSCNDASFSYQVQCEHGCYRGYCNMPPENYTGIGIIIVILFIIILFAIGLAG